MDMNIMLGPHQFSLQATIHSYGLSAFRAFHYPYQLSDMHSFKMTTWIRSNVVNTIHPGNLMKYHFIEYEDIVVSDL